jgi:hypothetical protein
MLCLPPYHQSFNWPLATPLTISFDASGWWSGTMNLSKHVATNLVNPLLAT